jgi:ribonuclease-3
MYKKRCIPVICQVFRLLLYSNTMNRSNHLKVFEERIGIDFRDTGLLEQVFIHTSYSHENPEYVNINNERLEFLGDSVLNFVISGEIFQKYPELPEGKLTEIRISLIREETLAEIATTLDLGKYLFLGKGEEATGGRKRQTNLADALEALIGALFLDQGLNSTKTLILDWFDKLLNSIDISSISINYKSRLQEFTQAKYALLPNYTLVEETGPDHDKVFTVNVILEDRVMGTGCGKSKKAAEMEAAHHACNELGIS